MKRSPLTRRTPLRRTPLVRKRRKPRPALRGCQMGGCNRAAYAAVGGLRRCEVHAADHLFSLRIRARDRSCRAEGVFVPCEGVQECAHLVTRRRHALRWSDQGAVGLCRAHHRFFTEHPAYWAEWLTVVRPTGLTYAEVTRLSQGPPERPLDALARMAV